MARRSTGFQTVCHTARGCPCPSPDACYGLRPSARSMLTSLRHPGCTRQQRRLSGTGSPSLHRSLVAQVFNLCAAPLGAAHAHRRTLTTAFQAFARSMLPSLRHRGFVRPATPALGHGQPLAASSVVAQVVNLCHGPSVRGGSGLHRSLVAQVVNLCHGAAQVENLRYRPHPSHRFSTWVCSRFGLGSQHHPSHVIHEGRAAGSGARAEDGDMCGHWAWVFRTSSELAHAAGFEHVTGRLRIPQRRARITGRPVLV